MAGPMINVAVGDKFNRLTVVEVLRKYAFTQGSPLATAVRVRCDCGNESIKSASKVRTGEIKSCGCYRKTILAQHAFNATHGMSRSAIYKQWVAMKVRSRPDFVGNGGCYADVGRDARWDSFDNFLADMGASWFPGAVLGRVRDQGDYAPGNCRWITKAENAYEAIDRRARRLPDGRIARQVALENGISAKQLQWRLKRGWSIERAVSEPIHDHTPAAAK